MRPGQQSPLLVLDGAYFGHRSYHTRSASRREAFVELILGVIAREQPEFLACAWDAEGPNYRHELYEDYKSNRPEKDPELVDHLRECFQTLRNLGIAVYEASGFEGDDVVATLARRWTRKGGRTTIYTADKDILQLVDDQTTVVVGGRGYAYDAVVDDYGVPPSLVSSFLALAGDSADGIPGIPGIGKMTAARLLNAFGSLEALVEAAPTTDDRRVQAIVGREKELQLFHQLTVLTEDVPLDVQDEDLVCLAHPANLRPELVEGSGDFGREVWRAAQRFHHPLAPYHERSLVFSERLALMHDARASLKERVREARRAAAGVQLLRELHHGWRR